MGTKLNKKIYNYVNLESSRLVSNVVNYSINQIVEEFDRLFKKAMGEPVQIELNLDVENCLNGGNMK